MTTMLRFGKNPPKVDYRTLRFKTYLTAALPPPPPACNALDQVFQKLETNDVASLFPIDGNDRYGDCTIAALAHAITVFAGRTSKKEIMAAAAVQKLYFKLTGGTDSGLNELDVLNYWRKSAVVGDKLLAFAKIDPKQHAHVQLGIQLFGGVYLGFQVQENAIDDFNAHRPWTPGTLTNDGHAVYAVAYDQQGVSVLTWGGLQDGTWAWWDECVDEAYALLPPEARKPDFAPGFDFAALQSDLNAVADV